MSCQHLHQLACGFFSLTSGTASSFYSMLSENIRIFLAFSYFDFHKNCIVFGKLQPLDGSLLCLSSGQKILDINQLKNFGDHNDKIHLVQQDQ